MAQLLIVYYSRSGNTKAMAELIADGAREVAGLGVDVRPVGEVSVDDLLPADGILMGSPVYYGTMAADIKKLIDESVCYHGKLDGKVGGAFASAGGLAGGNETTIQDILRALLVHGMVIKGEPMGDHYGPVAVGAPDERSQRECRKYGKMTGELTHKLHG